MTTTNTMTMEALDDEMLEQVNGGHECITSDGGTLWKSLKKALKPVKDWIKELF